MKVLIACEFTGIVRDAFLERGHDAYSCDFLKSESKKGKHYIGDVRTILDKGWDLLIAHPPCTFLSNSGWRWVLKNPERKKYVWNAITFFKALQDAPVPRIAIENPIPHSLAKSQLGNYTQLLRPYHFGHSETKAVCLWLKNLPLLERTAGVPARESKVAKMGQSKNRQKDRSRFFTGIAKAMAEQWG